jgi:thiamine-monophosphate kinase
VVLSERKLIERIRGRAAAGGNRALARAIGDDCAVLNIPSGSQTLVTTDLCVEDIHFRRAWHPARSVGHRCLTRGLSDIAAMGGEPVACFLSLGLPETLAQRWVDQFIDGLLRLAGQFRIPLAGGDISAAPKITADIVVIGQVPFGQALLRSGAKAGDHIYVSGTLGGSSARLQRLYAGEKLRAGAHDRHFFPEARVEAGRRLRGKKIAGAAIDLSDGLSVDLTHLCEESGVDAIIDTDAVPLAAGATLELALHGGEDYELLFTARNEIRVPPRIDGVPISRIGEIVQAARTTSKGRKSRTESRIQLRERSGKLSPLRPAGWQHFDKI